MPQEKELLRDDERMDERTDEPAEDRADELTQERDTEDTGENRSLSTEDIANANTRTEETPATQAADDPDELHELFPEQEVVRFRGEWQEIQTRFVDDPRAAVQNADQLVAEVMRSLADTFANHKHELEGQWQQGSEVETEDLRRALRRYRSFFNQMLSV